MGQTARNTTKADTQYRFRLSKELDARIDRAWREGSLKELDRQDFVIVLVTLGIAEYERRERIATVTSEVGEASLEPRQPEVKTKPRENANGA